MRHVRVKIHDVRREVAPASAVKLGGEHGLQGLARKESQVTTGMWVSLWPMPVSGGKVLTRPYVDSHRGYVHCENQTRLFSLRWR